jgi:hypothetical protein
MSSPAGGFLERGKAWLAKRSAVPWLIALGMLLTSPSLGAGMALDDFLFDVVLRHLPMTVAQTGPLDLFRFADGKAETARGLMDVGQIAWTSDPATRGAFLRPVSALTHILDYALWPHSPALMHLQNILWFGLGIGGAALVYRRLLGATWVAGLAVLLFAVDDPHSQVVSWISNRNALVAMALALPVVWFHDRARRDGWKPGAVFAPLLFAVALLAGESALAITAYLAAHALHVDRARWRSRILALTPYAAVVVLWRAAYSAFGFGVGGSSIYIDPGRQPLAFLAAVPHRIPYLLLGELATPRPDFAEFYDFLSPAAGWSIYGLTVLALVLLALGMKRLWREDPVARFFTTGLVLAAVPICATSPGERLLPFVSIGAMGLVAQFLSVAAGRGERALAKVLLAIHLVLAPPFLAIKSGTVAFAVPNDIANLFIPKTPDIEGKTVLLVNPPGELFGMVLIASRIVRGEPHPAYLRSLAPVTTAVVATRVDANSLALRPAHGFLEHTLERGWRTPEHPLLKGDAVHLTGLTVTVTDETPDLRPAEALFHFDVPLEDPSLAWYRWDTGRFVSWKPPAIGQKETLAEYDFAALLRGMTQKPPPAKEP